MITTMQQPAPLQANGARTSDWIGQIEGRVIYAYDIGSLACGEKRTDADEERLFGEHLSEAKRVIKDLFAKK